MRASSAGTATCPPESSRAVSRRSPLPRGAHRGAVPVSVCVSPALPAQPPAAAVGNPPREAGINTPSLVQLQAPGSQAVKLLKYFFFLNLAPCPPRPAGSPPVPGGGEGGPGEPVLPQPAPGGASCAGRHLMTAGLRRTPWQLAAPSPTSLFFLFFSNSFYLFFPPPFLPAFSFFPVLVGGQLPASVSCPPPPPCPGTGRAPPGPALRALCPRVRRRVPPTRVCSPLPRGGRGRP